MSNTIIENKNIENKTSEKRKKGRPIIYKSEEDIKLQQEKYKEKYEKKLEKKRNWRENVGAQQYQIVKILSQNILPSSDIQRIYHLVADSVFRLSTESPIP